MGSSGINADYMGSASSTATGATLPSFGRFVYSRIPTTTQDAPQRIEEGQEVWLKHLLPVLAKQIQEFKEAFGIIDNDKDGIITAPDLKKAFEGIGRPISDGEANNMVGEAPGP